MASIHVTQRDGWIGVDLDGTLAEHYGWNGVEHIGDPILPMVIRVKTWLFNGIEVRIVTARAAKNEDGSHEIAIKHIENWCLKHIGVVLKVTNEKDYEMLELWDDRCKQVIPNQGVGIEEIADVLKARVVALESGMKRIIDGTMDPYEHITIAQNLMVDR